jgi:tRNA nucleotidyltransferase (CCA-adding enzyme)
MTGSSPAKEPPTKSYFELFPHGADVGVRGVGPSLASAFEQAALALTSAVTDPAGVAAREAVAISCEATDDRFLLLDWLNALVYEMAVRRMVFGSFTVSINGHHLHGHAWGEPIDRARHMPVVEPKGATLTALKVERGDNGAWIAQCIVDV